MSDTILAVNTQALAAAHPAWVLPVPSGRLTQEAGVWRRERGGKAVAIHSRQPDREADAVVSGLLGDDRTVGVIVTIGLGLGYLLEALERRQWPGTVVALEPDPDTVTPLLARRDWSTWIRAGRLRLLVGPDYRGAGDAWRVFGDGAHEPAVFVNPQLAALDAPAVALARATLDRMRFDATANAEARRAFGGRYLLNTLRNIGVIAREGDAAALAGAGLGMPAVLIAAGPSLDAAMPSLRALRDRALLIAVDTALRPLLSAGIEPHIVVAVDPAEENARHLTDLPACPGTMLVAEGSVDPHAMQTFAGRTFLFNVSDHEPWPWVRAGGGAVGRLRAWGSVLTTAFDLALMLEAEPVAFVGADLSFTGGQPYARGVAYEEDWRRGRAWGESNERQWTRAIGSRPQVSEADMAGRTVTTAPHLRAFRDWFLEQACLMPGRTFVNATGRGILHGPGFEQVAPDALTTRLPAGRIDAGRVLRERHRGGVGDALLAHARQLLASPDGAAAKAVLDAWVRFAPGLTVPGVLAALEAALAPTLTPATTQALTAPPADLSPSGGPSIHPDVAVDDDALQALAAGTVLVPMVMPAHRLLSAAGGHRVFRFRTNAARIATCVLRSWTSSVLEDGVPLARANDLVDVPPGASVLFRGEVHFRPADDSDPRFNRRTYTVMVPPYVAHLEALPDATILAHDL